MTLLDVIEALKDGRELEIEDLRMGGLALDMVLAITLNMQSKGSTFQELINFVASTHHLKLEDIVGDHHPGNEQYRQKREEAKAPLTKTLH